MSRYLTLVLTAFTAISISLASACKLWSKSKLLQAQVFDLRSENEDLKAKNEALKAEVAKLKETDQSYFIQGVDALNAGKNQDSATIFRDLIQKYPGSPLDTQAREYIRTAEGRIAEAERRSLQEEAEKRKAEEEAERRQAKAEAEKRRAQEMAEKLQGTPIEYAEFFAKMKTGMKLNKRYRFRAKVSHDLCLSDPVEDSFEHGACGPEDCSPYYPFDIPSQYERFLKGPDRQIFNVTAAMVLIHEGGGTVCIFRLE
jgi:hypothetical protein